MYNVSHIPPFCVQGLELGGGLRVYGLGVGLRVGFRLVEGLRFELGLELG